MTKFDLSNTRTRFYRASKILFHSRILFNPFFQNKIKENKLTKRKKKEGKYPLESPEGTTTNSWSKMAFKLEIDLSFCRND